MNYTYLFAITLLSLKELNYNIFVVFLISIITFLVVFFIIVWYFEIDSFENELVLNNDEFKNDYYNNIFTNLKKENVNMIPEDTDDENIDENIEENISVSLSDIKYIKSIKSKTNNIKKYNIIPLNTIINKETIETINDLIKIAEYYEEKFLNKIEIKTEYLETQKIYKYNNECYTINLEKIYKIKKPLIKLKKMVGLTEIKNQIIDLLLYYLTNYTLNCNMLHMTLMGPPGCGKTKLAKIISEILNKMEILDSNKIIYAKSTDLIGSYVGHTGPKTQKVIDSALGGVLFIDEAYGIGVSKGQEHNFGAECINVLNQNLSDNKNKFICIIAGYEEQLEDLLFSINPGLKRRFPFRFIINGYSHQELLKIFIQKIYKLKWKIDDSIDLEAFFKDNYKEFKYFGGDIDTLIQNIKYANSRRVICNINNDFFTIEDINNGLEKLKSSRKNTSQTKQKNKNKLYNLLNKFVT
jgi:SpoVK/Ycf46/Vps4 family AAA+-type ATPase